MTKTTLVIEGMFDKICEDHINNAISRVFSFDRVSSNRKKGETVIISEHALNVEHLKATIEAAGYTLISVRSEPWTEMKRKKVFQLFKKE